jgi:hypothetical protein
MAKPVTGINSEKKVKAQVKKILDKHSWYWWCPPGSAFGGVGKSDFHALRGGVFMAIETKFGSNGLSPLQKGHLQSIMAERGLALVVDDRTLVAFKIYMELFDKQIELAGKKELLSADEGGLLLDCIKEMTAKMI